MKGEPGAFSNTRIAWKKSQTSKWSYSMKHLITTSEAKLKTT